MGPGTDLEKSYKHLCYRPVSLELDLETNMKMIGMREPLLAKYTIGCDNDGKLNGIQITYYNDCAIFRTVIPVKEF